jgi:tetratricopeptide (TPR) repeat protein
MNNRKIQIQFALSLALACASTAVQAQYIPLTELPEVPMQVNERGQIVTPHSQRGTDPFSDQLSLDVFNSVDVDALQQTRSDAPYGQIHAIPVDSISHTGNNFVVPDGGTNTPPLLGSRKDSNADGGWQGLANLLKKLEPAVDTSLPETRTQLSNRINSLINTKQYQAALNEIAKVFSSTGYIENPGEDVQLRFLEARAYDGLGQYQQALERYMDLISKYPELPEPYNNLAAMQMRLDLLDEAYESLTMAVTLRPNYGTAQRNLGMVHLLKAESSLNIAAKQRINGAAKAAQGIRQILQGN